MSLTPKKLEKLLAEKGLLNDDRTINFYKFIVSEKTQGFGYEITYQRCLDANKRLVPPFSDVEFKILFDLVLENVAPKIKEKKGEKEEQTQISFIFNEEENKLVEQVFDPKTNENKYCIYDIKTGGITYQTTYDYMGVIFIPCKGEELSFDEDHCGIILPSIPVDYESEEILDNQILVFISKWLDINDDHKQFALWNIKRSWVYDKFHTINYLRAIGDYGNGKSRYLDTLGYIHYKPIATSGATTAAPIFRIINKWKGTIILDEADYAKSDESSDIIKIINQGYEKGRSIMRCNENDKSQINFFYPFCPKIIATRNYFQDKATESRCITYTMTGTKRRDIPPTLNKSFWVDVKDLQNKLLMWRLKNWSIIDAEKQLDLGTMELEPRLRQITSSFAGIFTTDKQLELFKKFLIAKQEELLDERKNSFEGQIVQLIYTLYVIKKQQYISLKNIIEEGDLKDIKHDKPMKGQFLNKIINKLSLKVEQKAKRVDGTVKKCLIIDDEHLQFLFKKYFVDDDQKDAEKVEEKVKTVSIDSFGKLPEGEFD